MKRVVNASAPFVIGAAATLICLTLDVSGVIGCYIGMAAGGLCGVLAIVTRGQS